MARASDYSIDRLGDGNLVVASAQEISDFLRQVEKRAFRQTAYAVRDDHVALDIVQDAMLKLADKYASKPIEEYPMLFQRILQNTMRDFWRRQKVRNLWTTLFSAFGTQEDEDYDPLETIAVDSADSDPADQLERSQIMALIEKALTKLPARQREAFVLRYWEELDVAETASVMGCSEGSVKTHCSRAVSALSLLLEQAGIGSRRLPKKE